MIFLYSCKSSQNISKETNKKSETKKVQETYAGLLGVDQKKISNTALYSFIDEWYGVPYKYGQKSKNGIDCSGFTCILYQEVYKKNLNGTAENIYEQSRSVSRSDLKEGDLVFFKIDSKKISHIGIYLQNNKFVHASTKKGIMISDLNEEYFKKYYYKGGRF
jgi:lipoprotein Spr